MKRLSELYDEDPKLALEHVLSKDTGLGYVTMWQSQLGSSGKVRYGLYKKITRKMLEGRTFEVEFWDYDVSIFWTDVIYDEKLRKVIFKKEDDA